MCDSNQVSDSHCVEQAVVVVLAPLVFRVAVAVFVIEQVVVVLAPLVFRVAVAFCVVAAPPPPPGDDLDGSHRRWLRVIVVAASRLLLLLLTTLAVRDLKLRLQGLGRFGTVVWRRRTSVERLNNIYEIDKGTTMRDLNA